MSVARLLRRMLQPAPRAAGALILPAAPICVIGDVHGRCDLLDLLLAQLEQDPLAAQARLILVGDLVDRGPDSAGVLARTRALEADSPFASVTALMGNHERMMLDFLADPTRRGARWLMHGGEATLASFGVTAAPAPRGAGSLPRLTGLCEALQAALPAGMADWLAARPLLWSEGRIAVTHAGADPNLPLTRQPAQGLLWGHPDFGRRYRQDGVWVVHGHSIVPEAYGEEGRIAVDTGAYRSGRLTAAWLDKGGLRFVQAGSPAAGRNCNVASNGG